MEARPDRFTVFLDANVLVPALTRNLILSLADKDRFRICWSARVLDEFERAFLKVIPQESPERARKQRDAMMKAFPHACVSGYEALEPAFASGPDRNDAHVMAAAQHCGADVIVTDNLKDFPAAMLQPLAIEALSADHFIADAIDLDQDLAVAAIGAMRLRLKNPEITATSLLDKMRARGLRQSADLLDVYRAHL